MKILVPLFTALLAAGAYIQIPVPPVPITMQTLFVFLMGLLLGWKQGLASFMLYLFLGIIGLPIFTSGGGIAAATGPTAGYLWGMLPAILLGCLLSSRRHGSVPYNVLVLLVMEAAMYIPGLLWLGMSRSMTLMQTLAAGLAPFIIGDAIKIAVAAISAKALYPEILRLAARDER